MTVIKRWTAPVDDDGRLYSCRLEYNPDAPLEVHMIFPQPLEGREVIWVVGRDLLALGQIRDTGEGDMVFRPTDDGWLSVSLDNPNGTITLWFDNDDISRFLVAAYSEVPSGEEGPTVANDLDNWIAETLG